MTKKDKTDMLIDLLRKKAKNAKTQDERDAVDQELKQLQQELSKKRGKTKFFCRLPIDIQLKYKEAGITPFQ
jgi:hypothetical protein